MNTPPHSRVAPPTTGALVHRIGIPFFLFTAALAGLLSVSRAQLLPILTRLHVQGDVLTADDVSAREQTLRTQIAQLQQERRALLQPIRDEAFTHLQRTKRTMRSATDARAFLLGVARSLPDDDGAAVFLSSVRIDGADGTVFVEGDVRGVGPRSMTVLAGYVDALRAHPSVHALQTPAFVRDDEPGIGFHSPFVLSFVLGSGAAETDMPLPSPLP